MDKAAVVEMVRRIADVMLAETDRVDVSCVVREARTRGFAAVADLRRGKWAIMRSFDGRASEPAVRTELASALRDLDGAGS